MKAMLEKFKFVSQRLSWAQRGSFLFNEVLFDIKDVSTVCVLSLYLSPCPSCGCAQREKNLQRLKKMTKMTARGNNTAAVNAHTDTCRTTHTVCSINTAAISNQ